MIFNCFRFFKALCLIFALAVFAPAQSSIDALQHGQSKLFQWQAPTGYSEMAESFSREADLIAAEAHEWLGLNDIQSIGKSPRPGKLFWVRSQADIAIHLNHPVPSWFAAVALPGKGEMVLAVKNARGEHHLRSTMRHELLHHTLGALGAEAFQRIPSWFHEGLAEEFSGEIYLADSGLSLSWMAMSGGLRYLSDFETDFGSNTLRAAEGYALGHAFVSMLVRDYGQHILGEVLKEIHSGASLDHALIRTTGFSVITLEEQMRKELLSFRVMAQEFYRHLITVLFLFAAMLLPFVWLKKKRRRVAVEAVWAEQEEDSKLMEHAEAHFAPLEMEEETQEFPAQLPKRPKSD